MPTEDRFLRRHAQGKLVSLPDVRQLKRYASHVTIDGHFFEFDQGRFWHSDLRREEPEREAFDDGLGIPTGPWYHHSLCDCEVCAAEQA